MMNTYRVIGLFSSQQKLIDSSQFHLIGFALPDLHAKLAQKIALNAQLQNMQKLCILLAKKQCSKDILLHLCAGD